MEGRTIGQVAQEVGVNIETIRYYERLGLLSKPSRTKSGYRIFSTEAIQRIRFIRRSQNLGFTLTEIHKLLTLTDNENYSCWEVQQFTSQKLEEIERKIQDLQNIKNGLQDLLSRCGEDSMNICPIIERLLK